MQKLYLTLIHLFIFNVITDIDECMTLPTYITCPVCINTIGSYYCICDDGYTYDNVNGCLGKFCI